MLASSPPVFCRLLSRVSDIPVRRGTRSRGVFESTKRLPHCELAPGLRGKASNEAGCLSRCGGASKTAHCAAAAAQHQTSDLADAAAFVAHRHVQIVCCGIERRGELITWEPGSCGCLVRKNEEQQDECAPVRVARQRSEGHSPLQRTSPSLFLFPGRE